MKAITKNKITKKHKSSVGRLLRCVSLLGVCAIGSSVLTGCSGMMHQFGYARMQQPATVACAKAPVLITNLTDDKEHRHYQLPDGRQCPEVNYYEQEKLRQARLAESKRFL